MLKEKISETDFGNLESIKEYNRYARELRKQIETEEWKEAIGGIFLEMELSAAQKAAKKKYRQKVKRFTVDFYPTEEEIYSHLNQQENKQGFIKRLIKQDINHARK